MTNDLDKEIQAAIHGAEVRAVLDALNSGSQPRLGEIFNYSLDLPGALCKQKQKYQFAVEQWHLDAARYCFVTRQTVNPQLFSVAGRWAK